MKAKLSLLVFVAFVSGIFLYSDPSQKKDARESQQQQETGSLIRKDLLVPKNRKFPPPQRNIFVRQRMSSQPNETSSLPAGNYQMSNSETPSSQQETSSEDVTFNLTYIGYVESGNRIVALILWEGETYAVESGDVLTGGITIGEITPDDLEIIDSDSVSRRIKLEGEGP